ncbi:YceK/YidQ family lipoprotein [Leptospira borgpetersenii]|uniref:YceK/YidQ family lipoprotein n=1 Tax=Leptospira borgpetersenii TaxID=174 RepID=UPI00077477EA
MIRKIIVLLLIVLNLNCVTTAALTEAIKKQKEYVPYEGTLTDIFLISLGPFGTFNGKSTTFTFIGGLIDLPFSFVLDTILLPGIIPYYIYVKYDRPWSAVSSHKKVSARLNAFQSQNPPYVALKSILEQNDVTALQSFLKSFDVIALEKKIRSLQQANLLPYEHAYNFNESAEKQYYYKIGIIDYMAALFSTRTASRNIVPKTFNPGDRLEVVYTLYEEFRKDPILEKRYYDTVWKACFSSRVLIENPKILKKVLQEFSEKKEISDLFESIAQEYSEKKYKHFQDPFDDPYYFLNKTETQKFSELWYSRVELLTEIDDLLRKNPELQKEWKRTVWTAAISSGVIAYRPPLLERAFREFPMETAKSALNLFVAAHKSKNRQSVDIITQNLKDAKTFPLGQLEEEIVTDILKYPNLLEKLLQTGWNPNQILEWEKHKSLPQNSKRSHRRPEILIKSNRKEFIEKQETTLLILALQNDFIPMETVQILLKYGADPSLGVKRKSEGKEYLLYPLANINSNGNTILKELKQKTLIDWKK